VAKFGEQGVVDIGGSRATTRSRDYRWNIAHTALEDGKTGSHCHGLPL